ncbi:DUF4331 domain-containing protein [Mesorhizobium sp. M2E.F.Ca.ET.209.01.1.1]|uniref:DUF4331 family protein n=1 Tax=Mesorhizobium sp. M2E.F.Ca.ET.209.01.1.1 TaxID=2500526 RepID=UPI000FD6CE70|nr:DUF4331 family protein [Mesorhizobium sp. M2E.F.Ca.ET.209.01.1.1]TGS09650.1 DUF4331 domain-containing protein [Mesorhizobium sp. M2E.F.Ca.ET.209.01.1.1]
MSDHGSSPRAVADPVIDITDLFAFPSPERPNHLILVMNTFPYCGPSALFSDAIDYRIRLRPLTIASTGAKAAFAVGEEETSFSCTFSAAQKIEGSHQFVQEGVCRTAHGETITFRVNDGHGSQSGGLRVFAGMRLDPFFLNGEGILATVLTQKLAFPGNGNNTAHGYNVLSIVIEVNVSDLFKSGDGLLFAVAAETMTIGSVRSRLERAGRSEIKPLVLLLKNLDPVNRDLELRELYNLEDPFQLGPHYVGAYRARMNANLPFFDGLDGKTDWPLDQGGTHPLTELLLADFLVVDVSKPFTEDGWFEIERAMLKGEPHRTCGGRWLNHDVIDSIFNLLVNAGNGPLISDGVDQATQPSSRAFPFLSPPNPSPPSTLPNLSATIAASATRD